MNNLFVGITHQAFQEISVIIDDPEAIVVTENRFLQLAEVSDNILCNAGVYVLKM